MAWARSPAGVSIAMEPMRVIADVRGITGRDDHAISWSSLDPLASPAGTLTVFAIEAVSETTCKLTFARSAGLFEDLKTYKNSVESEVFWEARRLRGYFQRDAEIDLEQALRTSATFQKGNGLSEQDDKLMSDGEKVQALRIKATGVAGTRSRRRRSSIYESARMIAGATRRRVKTATNFAGVSAFAHNFLSTPPPPRECTGGAAARAHMTSSRPTGQRKSAASGHKTAPICSSAGQTARVSSFCCQLCG